MDHGYAVDVAHLLFTANADSHDTQRRRRWSWIRISPANNGIRDCGEKQSLNARPYNRNRISLDRAPGEACGSIGPEVAFRIHKSFLRGHSIRVDAILFRNYCRYYPANWPRQSSENNSCSPQRGALWKIIKTEMCRDGLVFCEKVAPPPLPRNNAITVLYMC